MVTTRGHSDSPSVSLKQPLTGSWAYLRIASLFIHSFLQELSTNHCSLFNFSIVFRPAVSMTTFQKGESFEPDSNQRPKDDR